jgi:hypothetical protein
MMNLEGSKKQFWEVHPQEPIIFASSGMVVKRLTKGNKHELGLQHAYYAFKGNIIISESRIYFSNPKKSFLSIFMLIAMAIIIVLLVPLIALMLLIGALDPVLSFVFIPMGLMLMIVFPFLFLATYQVMPRKFEIDFQKAPDMRVGSWKSLFKVYHRIDVFDGTRTFHFVPLKDLDFTTGAMIDNYTKDRSTGTVY